MKVFLSHARKDVRLAYQLAEQLTRAGFSVWLSDEHIAPRDNWAKKTGRALDEAQLMVVLLTPKALESDVVRYDIELAISSRKFEHRVFTVFVGPPAQLTKHVPWILRDLPNRQVESAASFADVAKEVAKEARSLRTKLAVGHADS